MVRTVGVEAWKFAEIEGRVTHVARAADASAREYQFRPLFRRGTAIRSPSLSCPAAG